MSNPLITVVAELITTVPFWPELNHRYRGEDVEIMKDGKLFGNVHETVWWVSVPVAREVIDTIDEEIPADKDLGYLGLTLLDKIIEVFGVELG